MSMSKNQIRLLSALLFSAILHAVIFSAIYMDSRDPENMAKKNINVKKSEEVNEVNTVMLTTSATNQKAEENEETALETNIEESKSVDVEIVKKANEDTSNNLEQDNVETIAPSAKLPVDIIKTNNDTATSSQNNTGGQLQVKSAHHSALLNNEKFLQNNEVAKDEMTDDEKRLRAEIEQINTQLSLAINEVKNRNQQHINQIRQQNLYVDVYED